MSEPIIIQAGLQSDGTTYMLHPTSRERVRAEFPTALRAPSVFVGYDVQSDFEHLHGSMWGQVAELLTGVTMSELRTLGEVQVCVPGTDRVFHVDPDAQAA